MYVGVGVGPVCCLKLYVLGVLLVGGGWGGGVRACVLSLLCLQELC